MTIKALFTKAYWVASWEELRALSARFLGALLGLTALLFSIINLVDPQSQKFIVILAAVAALLLMIFTPKVKYLNQRSTYLALLIAAVLIAPLRDEADPDIERAMAAARQQILDERAIARATRDADMAKLKEKEKEQKQTETQKTLTIHRGQTVIKSKLKDPDSAQFRNVLYSDAGGTPVACGEVNSRNSFGGMSGHQRFIAAANRGIAFLEEEVDDFATVWNKMCVGSK